MFGVQAGFGIGEIHASFLAGLNSKPTPALKQSHYTNPRQSAPFIRVYLREPLGPGIRSADVSVFQQVCTEQLNLTLQDLAAGIDGNRSCRTIKK